MRTKLENEGTTNSPKFIVNSIENSILECEPAGPYPIPLLIEPDNSISDIAPLFASQSPQRGSKDGHGREHWLTERVGKVEVNEAFRCHGLSKVSLKLTVQSNPLNGSPDNGSIWLVVQVLPSPMHSKFCRLMVQSAYWFKFCWTKLRNL